MCRTTSRRPATFYQHVKETCRVITTSQFFITSYYFNVLPNKNFNIKSKQFL